MTNSTLDKATRRAKAALRRSTRQALDCTTERAIKRTGRRTAKAQKHLAALGLATRLHGAEA